MLSRRFPTLALLIAATLSLAPGCASTPAAIKPLFPPSAELRPEPKPLLRPEDVESETALDRHDIALERWGERGWAAVARICRWSLANGAVLPFECPPPAAEPPGD